DRCSMTRWVSLLRVMLVMLAMIVVACAPRGSLDTTSVSASAASPATASAASPATASAASPATASAATPSERTRASAKSPAPASAAAPERPGGPDAMDSPTASGKGGDADASDPQLVHGDFKEEILLTGELKAVRARTVVAPETSIFQMRIQYMPDEGSEVK